MPQQSPDLSLTEQVAFSTVRIEVEFDGQKGFGTGFFFALLKDGDNSVPVIVTNKHGVQGAKPGDVVLLKNYQITQGNGKRGEASAPRVL